MRPRTIRASVFLVYGCALVACVAAIATRHARLTHLRAVAREHFIGHFARAFADSSTLYDILASANKEPQSYYDLSYLSDGHWIFVLVHNPRSSEIEDEWDAAVIRDSSGAVFVTEAHIAENESIHAELSSGPYMTLHDFYDAPPWPLASVEEYY